MSVVLKPALTAARTSGADCHVFLPTLFSIYFVPQIKLFEERVNVKCYQIFVFNVDV